MKGIMVGMLAFTSVALSAQDQAGPLRGCIEDDLKKLESKGQWKEALDSARRWLPENWCGTCRMHDVAVRAVKIALYELKLGQWKDAKADALKALQVSFVSAGEIVPVYLEASFRLGELRGASGELGQIVNDPVAIECLKEFDLLEKGDHAALLTLLGDALKEAYKGWFDWESVLSDIENPQGVREAERRDRLARAARISGVICLVDSGRSLLNQKIDEFDKVSLFAVFSAGDSSFGKALEKLIATEAAKRDYDLRLLAEHGLRKVKVRQANPR